MGGHFLGTAPASEALPLNLLFGGREFPASPASRWCREERGIVKELGLTGSCQTLPEFIEVLHPGRGFPAKGCIKRCEDGGRVFYLGRFAAFLTALYKLREVPRLEKGNRHGLAWNSYAYARPHFYGLTDSCSPSREAMMLPTGFTRIQSSLGAWK